MEVKMCDYKSSQYNFMFKANDNTHLAYNSYSGAFLEIEKANYRDFKKLLNDPQAYLNSEYNEELVEKAKKGRFIVTKEIDEFALIKLRSNVHKYSLEFLQLTMMPTLDCNFRCPYCYESLKKGKMTKEYRDRFILWLKDKLKGTRHLSISWFGGEPLMAFDVVDELMINVKRLCKRNSVKYTGSMTTNGFYLTKRITEKLDQLGINTFQVTLDGPPSIHDQTRVLKNGKGTFDRIIKNLTHICTNKKNMNVIIRVNFNEESYPLIATELFDNIPDAIRDHASIYFRQTFAPPVWWDENKPKKTSSVNPESKALNFRELYNIAQNKGFTVFLSNILPTGGYCEADYFNHFVIDPKCNLHKCTVAFDEKHRVGYLDENGKEVLNLPLLAKWMSRDIFNKDHCKKCKLISICQGGCGFTNLCHEDSNFCAIIKDNDNLVENLKLLYNNYKIEANRKLRL